MFVYTIARSVNKGYLEQRYSSIALRGWEGVASKILPDGEIEGVSAGTGVSEDLVYYIIVQHRSTIRMELVRFCWRALKCSDCRSEGLCLPHI